MWKAAVSWVQFCSIKGQNNQQVPNKKIVIHCCIHLYNGIQYLPVDRRLIVTLAGFHIISTKMHILKVVFFLGKLLVCEIKRYPDHSIIQYYKWFSFLPVPLLAKFPRCGFNWLRCPQVIWNHIWNHIWCFMQLPICTLCIWIIKGQITKWWSGEASLFRLYDHLAFRGSYCFKQQQ